MTKLKEECDKLNRDNILSHRRICPDGLSYPVNYCHVKKSGLGVGVAHLPAQEALGADKEARNFPTSEEIRLESVAFQRMTGKTARISTREVTEERFLQEWGPVKYSEFEWPSFSKTVPFPATPSPPRGGKDFFLF